MAGNPLQDMIGRLKSMLRLGGKGKEDLVLRKPVGKAEENAAIAGGAPVPDTPVMRTNPKSTQSKMVALGEKRPIGKDQWSKLKETAKETDPIEGNLEHWQKNNNSIAGTSFSASSDTEARRKRPSMVTQARITSNRLQALQTRMEAPKNEIDKRDEEDPNVPRGH